MSTSALRDIVVAAIIFAGVYFALQALHLPAPGTFALVATLAFATWRLAAAGPGWAGAWGRIGLRAPPSWLRLLRLPRHSRPPERGCRRPRVRSGLLPHGRQLLPLVLAHGLIDSVSLIAIFAGAGAALRGG